MIEPKDLIERFSNTIYLGTFSKAYGLGGMRVGYGIASEQIIQNLHKLRPPFNITTLSLKASIEAMKDESFVNEAIEKNFSEMKRYEEFAKKNYIKFIDSYTNFITLIFDESFSASSLADKLLQKGVIVRSLKSYGVNAIRITIGKSEQNSKVLLLLDELIKGE
jgi:histidinol-phosphate aminotransferase